MDSIFSLSTVIFSVRYSHIPARARIEAETRSTIDTGQFATFTKTESTGRFNYRLRLKPLGCKIGQVSIRFANWR
jgi:hypothetical protein